MSKFLLPLTIWLVLASGCSGGTTGADSNRQGSAGSDPNSAEGDDEWAGGSEPVEIAGINLTMACAEVQGLKTDTEFAFGCSLRDAADALVPVTKVASTYKWQASSTAAAPTYRVTELATPSADGHVVVYYLNATGSDAAAKLKDVRLELNLVELGTDVKKTLSSRLAKIFAGLRDQKFVRFIISSIRAQATSSVPDILTLTELKVGERWLTFYYEAPEFRLGDYVIKSNATAADVALLSGLAGVSPVVNVSNLVRFGKAEPHDAKEPLQFTIEFPEPQSIRGIRYNKGLPLKNRNPATGFPDRLHFDVSSTGVNWSTVPGSDIKIDATLDRDVLEYVWEGGGL